MLLVCLQTIICWQSLERHSFTKLLLEINNYIDKLALKCVRSVKFRKMEENENKENNFNFMVLVKCYVNKQKLSNIC